MNKIEQDILLCLKQDKKITQRDLSKKVGCSVGMINKSINNLYRDNWLNELGQLTNKATLEINKNKPQNAIILAAGKGLRMVPINKDISKGFLKIKGTTIIENIIEKLTLVGIKQIVIVVGYRKEEYEYLIDKYNVKLIVNPHYNEKNNFYSFYLARKYLCNSYIIPCDVWYDFNIFQNNELYSSYYFSDEMSISNYLIHKNFKLSISKQSVESNRPLSIGYLNYNDSKLLLNKLESVDEVMFLKKHYYWEDFVIENLDNVFAKKMKNQFMEINTFEDLRNADDHSESLYTDVIKIIVNTLKVNVWNIKNITLSKKGMTNNSFLFEIGNEKYIMRIPGEGTDRLINRFEEGQVYEQIKNYKISDEVIYFNNTNGYKLTKFIKQSRNCDPNNEDDLILCMDTLRNFHNLNLKVNHIFDLYDKISFYEELMGMKSLYSDYAETKKNILSLKTYINKIEKKWTLTHIDAVPDNFLIYEQDGYLKVRLIDWEYASMQDGHVDIAMFCIYAMYDKTQVDRLIDIYFKNKCKKEIRFKIYCYIAICGLLWSNWCEYKYHLGVEFGEYSLAQYRYAKEYYKIAMNYMEEHKICIK